MNQNDKIYIELNVSKMIELYIEVSYSKDKLGNLIIKDRNKLKEKINDVILETAQELEVSQDEIRNNLIEIYISKCMNENYIKEGMDLISILKEEIKEENKSETSIKNGGEEIR